MADMPVFSWLSDQAEERWNSLHRLIKRNDGEFVSDKQAAFFRKNWGHKPTDNGLYRVLLNEYQKQYGEFEPYEYVIFVEGVAKWSIYGGRGNVTILFLFVMDDAGVVRKVKHTKTKGFELKWERSHEPKRPKMMSKTAKKPSEYVGTPGKRIETRVTVKKIIEIANDWGTIDIIVMEDENDNVLKWATSSFHGMEEDGEYRVRATVKEHELYRGIKQTVVTRVKVVKDLQDVIDRETAKGEEFFRRMLGEE